MTTAPNGIFTINNQFLTHGVLSDARDLFIFVDWTPANQGHALSIFIRRSPPAAAGTNLLLLQK